jgi:osmotically-inducible protein OsmY
MKKAALAGTTLVIAMALAGCNESRKTTLGLDVNLYVHPTSADPMDVLLQTAITKRLNESTVTRLSLIHVRVEERNVTLTGTAKDQVRDEAERIARQTELTLNGESIRPREPINNKIAAK